MFRKEEEAVKQWSEDHVKMCAARQKEILEDAASMLKPGGTMVYSTCLSLIHISKAQETAAPTQAPSESAVVQPVETTASAENATQEVGPAFATKAPADEIGPGV